MPNMKYNREHASQKSIFGANASQKRRKLFYYFKKLKKDVACLQDMHTRTKDIKSLAC